MNRRAWQHYEDEYLRRYYRRGEPVAVMVSNLERPAHQIYNRARNLGLAAPMVFIPDSDVAAALREFHPQGWSDQEISDHLQSRHGIAINRHRVNRIRRDLGLPSNALSQHRRNQVRQRTAEQLRLAGLSSLGQLRSKRFAEAKRALGWPEHLTILAVQAVELFWRRGPMTRMQLCHAMGFSEQRARVRTEPKSNAKGGTVLAELQRAGLVMVLRRSVHSGRDRRGGKRMVDLYLLNPGVQPNGRQQEHTQAC